MRTDRLPEPWQSFLRELDQQLNAPTELHCVGGFVVAKCYGFSRATADIDILESRGTNPADLAHLAGKGSTLHKRHKVFVDVVTLADVPDNYEDGLVAVEGGLQHPKPSGVRTTRSRSGEAPEE